MSPHLAPRSRRMSSALPLHMGSHSLKACLRALQPSLGATMRTS